MDAIGAMDLRYDAIDDVDRARRLPSLQLIGTPGRETIDLNSLRKAGVEIVGRLAGMRDGKLQFSASLPESLRSRGPQDEPAVGEHRRVDSRERAGRIASPRRIASSRRRSIRRPGSEWT